MQKQTNQNYKNDMDIEFDNELNDIMNQDFNKSINVISFNVPPFVFCFIGVKCN